jgi:hypothetical protein
MQKEWQQRVFQSLGLQRVRSLFYLRPLFAGNPSKDQEKTDIKEGDYGYEKDNFFSVQQGLNDTIYQSLIFDTFQK